MIVMHLLAEAGFKINLKKCQFLIPRVVVLGYVLHDHGYQLAAKTLKNWVGQRLPTTLKEL